MNDRSAESICLKAAGLVSGERARTHGPSKLVNHQNIADLWNAYLGDQLRSPITAKQAALLMVLLKVARSKYGAYNPDDYDDIVGYGAVAGEIAAQDTWLPEAAQLGVSVKQEERDHRSQDPANEPGKEANHLGPSWSSPAEPDGRSDRVA